MYYELHPEVPGGFGRDTVVNRLVTPPRIEFVHLVLDGWLGDDLLTCYPCYFITDGLRAALSETNLTGYQLQSIKTECSTQFRDLYGSRPVPTLHRIVILGKARIDDFGLNDKEDLIVSDRTFKLMKANGRLNNCEHRIIT